MLGILELTLFNDTTYLQNIEYDADGTKQWFRAALNYCLLSFFVFFRRWEAMGYQNLNFFALLLHYLNI